MSLKLYIWGSL